MQSHVKALRAGVLGLCLAPGAALAGAEALGTVLLTPAQRQAIGRARVQSGQANQDSALLRLDGVILSSAGTAAAWLNGREVGPGAADAAGAANAAGAVLEAGAVRVGQGPRLKVGQSALPESGVVAHDLVPSGSVVSAGAAQSASLAASTPNLQLQRSTGKAKQP